MWVDFFSQPLRTCGSHLPRIIRAYLLFSLNDSGYYIMVLFAVTAYARGHTNPLGLISAVIFSKVRRVQKWRLGEERSRGHLGKIWLLYFHRSPRLVTLPVVEKNIFSKSRVRTQRKWRFGYLGKIWLLSFHRLRRSAFFHSPRCCENHLEN